MGRKTKYNRITTEENLSKVNPENSKLKAEFLTYLQSVQRSAGTIRGYSNDLDIVMVFLLERCGNKRFIDAKKRDWLALQSWLIDDHGNSPARVRRIKAAVSSLSNFVVNVLQEDDEPGFEKFKPTIKGVESPVNVPVREKTILTDAECQYILDRLVDSGKYEQACYFSLAINSGRRKSELFRFKVEHFGDDHLICDGALYTTKDLIRSKGRGVLGKQIPFYTLAQPFKPYFDLWMQERERCGIQSVWLFPMRGDMSQHKNGESANPWAVTYSRLLTECRGEESTAYLHCCRHMIVSKMIRAGIPQNVVKEFMNWSTVGMVTVYDDNDATDSFSDYFKVDGMSGGQKKALSDL